MKLHIVNVYILLMPIKVTGFRHPRFGCLCLHQFFVATISQHEELNGFPVTRIVSELGGELLKFEIAYQENFI